MTMPITERYELFKTVADLHNEGKVKLSTEHQRQIERETLDLIRKSMLNPRSAAKAPMGFEDVLRDLELAKGDADAAYNIVLDFLKGEGIVKEEMEGVERMESLEEEIDEIADGPPPKPKLDDKIDLPGPPKMEGPGKLFDKEELRDEAKGMPGPKMDGPPMDGPKGPKGPPPEVKDMADEKHEEREDESEEKDDKEEKKSEPPKPKDKDEKKDKGDDDKDELKEKREAVLKRAQDQEAASDHKSIKDLQEAKAEREEAEISTAEMGVEDGPEVSATDVGRSEDMTAIARAAKCRVVITKSGTLVAQHEDHGPVFHAVPSPEIRRNKAALRKLANRVHGMLVYEGFAVAAQKCNAKLLKSAGVDDDIVTDHGEIPPETQGVLADAESVNREEYDEPEPDSALPGNEVDTREKPPTVSDTKTKMIASEHKEAKDILDEAENVTKELKPDKPSGNTNDEAETNAQEQHSAPREDVLADAEDVIRNANTNYGELYKRRAEKQLAEEKEAFVRKFIKATRIAASRMLLNHDEHPMKVAAVDVLTADNIEFSNGEDRYSGMDVAAAVELTELIATEGHEEFVNRLLSKAGDLMDKSDEYLADLETDLQHLAPQPVGEGMAMSGKKEGSIRRRSAERRREAAEGNFEINSGAPGANPQGPTDGIRDAVGGTTLLGRRLGRLQG